jgi:hypothetical protein
MRSAVGAACPRTREDFFLDDIFLWEAAADFAVFADTFVTLGAVFDGFAPVLTGCTECFAELA